MRFVALLLALLAGCGPSEEQIFDTLDVEDRVVVHLPLEVRDGITLVVIRDTSDAGDALRTIVTRNLVPRRLLRHADEGGNAFELGVRPQGNGMMQNLPGLGYIAYDGDRGRINLQVARREDLRMTEVRESDREDRLTHAAFRYTLVPTLSGVDMEPQPRTDSGAIAIDARSGAWAIERPAAARTADLRQVAEWVERAPPPPRDEW